ncbi:MAG: DUF2088 domain-containing protein [Candidatus Aminicenantes bacterium]|nr:DUF2088 domain-containing protein [Candidatus Aminicenantes bacterium]
MELPRMIRIRQLFEQRSIEDLPREVEAQLDRVKLQERIMPGQSVAIACSSRGIANYADIVRSVVAYLKKLDLDPFIVPAMGSHGSATAAGQKSVLEHLGLTERRTGAVIRSSLDVTQIGETDFQLPVYVDKIASEADGIVLINRIKKHTDYEGEIESGLMKIMAIGLGKQVGAETYHRATFAQGYFKVIRSVARTVLQKMPVLFGLGVIEDSYARTASVHALLPEEIEEREKDLLEISKKLTPGLPFEDVDVLIIDEIGKDISGSGFDTKVVGRINLPLLTREPESPRVKRIIACDLTEATEGNASGLGNADFVTQRLMDKTDVYATNMNCLSSCTPEGAKIPPVMKNDRDAIEMAVQCVGMIPTDKLKIVRIRDTLHLIEVDVSEAYRDELLLRDDLKIVKKEKPFVFDGRGNLVPFE